MRARLIAFIVAGFLIGALAGAVVLLVSTPQGGQPVQSSGTALVGGPFSLVGADGKPVTDRDFRGRYMLIFFGFTHCPDICPAELQVIAQALEQLGDKAKTVVPIFITLDPERDTPEAMANYVKSFGGNFVGLTGSPEAIAVAAKAYRVAYAKVENKDSATDYSVDHSAFVYLMDPEGRYVTHFSYGLSADQMAEKLGKLL
ncbi:SCO family protein [Methyloceanibacter sp.]|uniref:SCO family protein n=1 Tax=Methyloceanibacter sp. TaxID=1965321 RepID=UPI003D6CD847